VHSLPVFLRLKGRPVILVGDGPAVEAKRRLLERAEAKIVTEETDAPLSIVALDDPDEAVARLKARGILVNAVDRPDLCDFTLPAIIDRDPVLVAIGTGGASAGLAKALRQRLERLLPGTLGALATAMQDARSELRRRWPEANERRSAIDAALEEGGRLDPFRGGSDVAAWLADAAGPTPDQLVAIEFASPDPDELTLRQARLLGQADRVFHRPEVPAAILHRVRADAQRIACARAPDEPGSGLSLDLSMRAV
jgi:uroporphyrin-III C-methyltransferase/precorrin-2 dehydrogenase/sirohydrochlorin ferrochelatase